MGQDVLQCNIGQGEHEFAATCYSNVTPSVKEICCMPHQSPVPVVGEFAEQLYHI